MVVSIRHLITFELQMFLSEVSDAKFIKSQNLGQ
jgi:hypothetical protein